MIKKLNFFYLSIFFLKTDNKRETQFLLKNLMITLDLLNAICKNVQYKAAIIPNKEKIYKKKNNEESITVSIHKHRFYNVSIIAFGKKSPKIC